MYEEIKVIIKTITRKALCVGVLSAFSSSVLALECQNYAYTGSPETLTVPDGATQATIKVLGADGGNASNNSGGAGGSAEATFAVTPGQTITAIVGEAGKNSNSNNFEAGGGGGSGIFLDNAVLIVAGGGGGGDNTGPGGGGGQSGEDGTPGTGNIGGAGGTGGNGGGHGDDNAHAANPGTGGGGGLNTDGGTSPRHNNSATGGGACFTAGVPTGGAGGIDYEQNGDANGGYGCGGGGGGSEYESGGGGGYSGGGGAGSSGYPGGGGTFVANTALSQTITAGANGGSTLQNGEVEVCFPADVAVVKTLDTAGPYVAGQSVTFSITVSNLGPNQATNINVTDTPANLTIDTVSSASCSALPCTIPSLDSGANEVITVTATIGAAGGFTNDVTIAADEDTDVGNNASNAGDTAVAGADVAVSKDLSTAGPYVIGQTVTYNITVSNNGSLTATNITVNDTPTNLSMNTVSSPNCNALPCTIPSLANGANEVITVAATINSAGIFDNAVEVSADQPDPDLTNNSDNTGNGGTAQTPIAASDDVYTTPVDTPVAITPLVNDTAGTSITEINGVALTGGVQSIPAPNGTVEIDAAGNITFVPDTGYTGSVTFPYTISDGSNTDAANITVTIMAPPIAASDDAYTTAFDTPVAITPLVNDTAGTSITEINGVALTGGVQSIPVPNGTVEIDTAGNMTFVPNPGYTGSAVFPYTISDGTNTATANVTVTIDPAPIAATNDAYTTPVDTPVAITPLVNDTAGATITEINGVTLTGNAQSIPVPNGTVEIDAAGNMTFVPNSGYTGPVTFPYTISDNNGNTATANITITIASSVAPNRVPATSIWSLLMLIGLISLLTRYYRVRR